MWLTTPECRARPRAAATPDHDTDHRCGRPGSRTAEMASVSRSAPAAPRSQPRGQSRREPRAARARARPDAATQRHTSRSASARTIVAGSQREVVRPPVVQRQAAHEQRQIRRHGADRDRRRHERRADERQRDDRVARRERHRSTLSSRATSAWSVRRRTRRRASSCRGAAPTLPRAATAVTVADSSSTLTPVERHPALGDRAPPLGEARDEAGVDERLQDAVSPPRTRGVRQLLAGRAASVAASRAVRSP